jgi:DNA-binding transcriptional regulator YiaG
MTDWTYPGDEAVRLAFSANVLKAIKEKNLTPDEIENRIAVAHKRIDYRLHERAFGLAVRKLREERNMSRKVMAVSAKISVRLVTRVERGRGGDISVPEVCRIACALKLLPHELMEYYQNAVKEANASEVWW